MKSYERILVEEHFMNPFTLTFGVIPEHFIKRDEIKTTIFSDFNADKSESNVYILTGVRGSGKTVMLNYLKKQFDELNDWIVLTINPEMDILESIASKLYEKGMIKRYFVKASFNFSFSGLGFSIEGDNPVKNIETLIEKMLTIIQKKNKKVLIAIDEVSNSANMRVFSHTFKNLVNDNYPLYLLATGINENIYNLQNEKTLTFIYRAKKIEVKSLNLSSIARSYQTVLGLSSEIATKCAALTEGYASAYQILGSILYETKSKDVNDDVLAEFDRVLEDINYGKLWEDLSLVDKQFLYGFTKPKNNKANDIIKNSNISKESYSHYRDRLLKRGIVKSESYGYLSLALPRLFQFIENKKKFDII